MSNGKEEGNTTAQVYITKVRDTKGDGRRSDRNSELNFRIDVIKGPLSAITMLYRILHLHLNTSTKQAAFSSAWRLPFRSTSRDAI